MRADKFGNKVEGKTDLIELRSALLDLCESVWRPYQPQAVSRRAFTVQKRVQSKVRSPEICRWQIDTRTRVSPTTSLFSCHYNPSSVLFSFSHLSPTPRNLNIWSVLKWRTYKEKTMTVINSENKCKVSDHQSTEKGIKFNTDLGHNFAFCSEVLTVYRAVKFFITDSSGLLQSKPSVQTYAIRTLS
jgi:hypothetical protein